MLQKDTPFCTYHICYVSPHLNHSLPAFGIGFLMIWEVPQNPLLLRTSLLHCIKAQMLSNCQSDHIFKCTRISTGHLCLTGIKTFPESNCGTFSSTTTARIKVTFIVCLCQTLLVLTRRGSLSVESSRAIPIIYLPCKNPSFCFGEPTRGGEVVCFFSIMFCGRSATKTSRIKMPQEAVYLRPTRKIAVL